MTRVGQSTWTSPEAWRRYVLGHRRFTLSALALVACSREVVHTPRHEEPPPITIRVEPGASAGLTAGLARRIPAPPVRFPALLDQDLNHPSPITAGQSGRLRWVRPSGEVAPRESLAVAVPLRRVDTTEDFRVLAQREGTWWPWARAGDAVWGEDVIGLFQPHGLSLAAGSLPDYDAEFVHTGDSAVVRFPDRSEPPHRGRVERLRYPRTAWLPVDVWVEIRHVVRDGPRGLVEVEVVPTGPGDSVYAVPVSAIATLSQGSAVFSPVDSLTFRVLWVVPGPRVDELVVVRRGIGARIRIVSGNLSRLIEEAEDSLRVPGSRQ